MSNKLLRRIQALEASFKPDIKYPPFYLMYESEEVERYWFEQNNPHHSYDEFNNNRIRFHQMYEDAEQ